MKRIHPNARHAVPVAALVVLIGAVGCQSPSGGGIANPFLAPNRVPPPATRAILPGQAQPYYPGDPLPVMQSNTAPTVEAGGLAWNAPGGSSPTTNNRGEPASPAFSTERTVAIPADNDSLRFALPGTVEEPAPITPIAPVPIQAAAPAPNRDVLQASYSEPVLNNAAHAPVSPWQPPQIAPSTLPPPPPVAQPLVGQAPFAPPIAMQPTAGPPVVAQPMLGQPTAIQPVAGQPTLAQPPVVQPYYPMQLAVAPNTMDVRLRAVASPPPEPVPSSAPRIRLPGELAPPSASKDGFRPRSSMR